MTVGAALAAAREVLGSGSAARFDAQRLLATLLGRTSAWLFAHEDYGLDETASRRFRVALERRAAGEPVAYILGESGFYGRRFAITPAVLVPRPESELLVTLALEALRPWHSGAMAVCDVGTGSGILAITLALELPRAAVTAIDVSAAALACARHNAREHRAQTRIRFVLGDALAALARAERFSCIIANLPYVRTSDLLPRPDPTAFEPRLALDGGADGLDVYRKLLARAEAALIPGGTLLMEAGPDTARGLAELSRRAFGAGARISGERDYAGHERVVRVEAAGERPAAAAKTPIP